MVVNNPYKKTAPSHPNPPREDNPPADPAPPRYAAALAQPALPQAGNTHGGSRANAGKKSNAWHAMNAAAKDKRQTSLAGFFGLPTAAQAQEETEEEKVEEMQEEKVEEMAIDEPGPQEPADNDNVLAEALALKLTDEHIAKLMALNAEAETGRVIREEGDEGDFDVGDDSPEDFDIDPDDAGAPVGLNGLSEIRQKVKKYKPDKDTPLFTYLESHQRALWCYNLSEPPECLNVSRGSRICFGWYWASEC